MYYLTLNLKYTNFTVFSFLIVHFQTSHCTANYTSQFLDILQNPEKELKNCKIRISPKSITTHSELIKAFNSITLLGYFFPTQSQVEI